MGQALPLPVTTKYVERFGNQHFRGAVVSMQGWRTDMEDSHVMDVTDTYGLFGVFDGHAGADCSAKCSKMLSERIAKASLPLSDDQLQQMILDIDQQFLTENDSISGSTATFCIALPKGNEYHVQVGNVGDSRIVVGSGGVPRPMTKDHKPSLPEEEKRIKAAGGFVQNDRVNGDLAVSRALGDRPYKSKTAAKKTKKKKALEASAAAELKPTETQVIALPDVAHAVLKPGEWLLAACDGIFEPTSFTTEEVVKFLSKQLSVCEDIGEVACRLCTEALKRGSTDNMTAMIIQMVDGSSFGQPGQLIPGPFDVDMGAAKKRYFGFAKEYAGLSIGQVLESRHDLIKQKVADLQQKPAPPPVNFSSYSVEELKDWLVKYGIESPQLPKKRIALLKMCKSEQLQHKFYEEDDAERLLDELKFFKEGPPAELSGEGRTAWFSSLMREDEIENEEELDDEALDLANLSPEALRQLAEQGFLQELQEEIDEMQQEAREKEEEKEGAKGANGGQAKPAKRKRATAKRRQQQRSEELVLENGLNESATAEGEAVPQSKNKKRKMKSQSS